MADKPEESLIGEDELLQFMGERFAEKLAAYYAEQRADRERESWAARVAVEADTQDRIVTPSFVKDTDELRTWMMDIRQVLADNPIKSVAAD